MRGPPVQPPKIGSIQAPAPIAMPFPAKAAVASPPTRVWAGPPSPPKGVPQSNYDNDFENVNASEEDTDDEDEGVDAEEAAEEAEESAEEAEEAAEEGTQEKTFVPPPPSAEPTKGYTQAEQGRMPFTRLAPIQGQLSKQGENSWLSSE